MMKRVLFAVLLCTSVQVQAVGVPGFTIEGHDLSEYEYQGVEICASLVGGALRQHFKKSDGTSDLYVTRFRWYEEKYAVIVTRASFFFVSFTHEEAFARSTFLHEFERVPKKHVRSIFSLIHLQCE